MNSWPRVVGGGVGVVYTEEALQQSENAATVEEDLTYMFIHSFILYLMSRLVRRGK